MDQFAGEGETHVAQKSRRDKLRGNVAPSPDFHHRPSSHVQLMCGDVVVDPGMFSSHQALGLHQNPSLQTPIDLFMTATAQTPQNFGSWRRVFSSSSPNSDWAVKCNSDGISDCSSNHGFLSTPASVTPPPPPLPFGSSQPTIPTAVPWLFDGCQDYNTNGSELALLPATNISPTRINNATPVWLPSDLTANHDCCSSTTQNRLSLTLSSNPTHPPLPVHPQSSSDVLRGVGPLGPFTGYATILKSSKYLKPAQMLLDERCGGAIAGSFPINSLSSLSSKPSVNANHDGCGNGTENISTGACHSRLQEKKAKLLLMQSEVSRSFKHYNQQIQMAISSFKSVGGLSAAMPFLKSSMKSITKHFRFLRGVISDQLLTVSKNLSEVEVRSVDHFESSSGMKFLDQALLRRNTEESSVLGGFVKNQTRNCNSSHNQATWKPQRGLPERAVAVLRAWLFDHFLHPYPTDTDKMMLATQTGLSRNQVSNWFINARVRVWKPMVEEIHTLDTKGLAKMDLNSSTNTANQHDHLGEVQPGVLESESAVAGAGITENSEEWVAPDQNKRARVGVDSGVLTTIFSGYPCVGDGGGGEFDMGELGLVSLTLGLRQEEASQRDEQMRAYFGTQLVREYVG